MKQIGPYTINEAYKQVKLTSDFFEKYRDQIQRNFVKVRPNQWFVNSIVGDSLVGIGKTISGLELASDLMPLKLPGLPELGLSGSVEVKSLLLHRGNVVAIGTSKGSFFDKRWYSKYKREIEDVIKSQQHIAKYER